MAEEKGVGLRGWLSGPRSKEAKAETSQRLAGPPDVKRIAVLPFASMSPDPNDSFFADGITEEIISTLSGISGLRIISRTSVMAYKGTKKKMVEIGHELEVGSVLEGSLRKAGDTIRVTAQLISVSGDEHVWAQSYNKQLDDVFAVQADIAKQVAEALRVRILKPEMTRLDRRPTSSMKAHTSYLMGRHHWNTRTVKGLEYAIVYFNEAVREDKNFALGYVGLADCHQILATNWGIDKRKNLETAKMFLAKALELEPDLAEARATRGLLLFDDFAVREAEREFRRAIELKPSYASAHQWLHQVLLAESRMDEALREIQIAAELDPASPIINRNLSAYYYVRRDYEKALETDQRIVDPGFAGFAHFGLAVFFGKLKMLDDAKREVSIAVKLERESYPDIEKTAELAINWLEGDKDAVRSLMPQYEGLFGRPWIFDAWEVAAFYFWLGENEKGFEWLERSYSMRETVLLWCKYDDRFDSVRADPRFVDFFGKIAGL